MPRTAGAETGETVTLKSGPGGGGVTPPPPQLARSAKAESVQASLVVRDILHTPKSTCIASAPATRTIIPACIVNVVKCSVERDVPRGMTLYVTVMEKPSPFWNQHRHLMPTDCA